MSTVLELHGRWLRHDEQHGLFKLYSHVVLQWHLQLDLGMLRERLRLELHDGQQLHGQLLQLNAL
jgi:hypothetical protein